MNIEMKTVKLVSATPNDLPVIQNMARFYAYDLSKSCGFYSLYDWSFPENGLYEARDLSDYWKPGHYPFVILVENELAGFALIDKTGTTLDVDWNIGEFFIVGKFQGKGVGRHVAIQIFNQFAGTWEVMQMPDNTPAIKFWKKVVADYTKNEFMESRKTILEPEPHDNIVLKFTTKK